jgi:hypothetical protein
MIGAPASGTSRRACRCARFVQSADLLERSFVGFLDRRFVRQLLAAHLQVEANRRQRVAYLVRQRRGKLAHGRERLAIRQLAERAT